MGWCCALLQQGLCPPPLAAPGLPPILQVGPSTRAGRRLHSPRSQMSPIWHRPTPLHRASSQAHGLDPGQVTPPHKGPPGRLAASEVARVTFHWLSWGAGVGRMTTVGVPGPLVTAQPPRHPNPSRAPSLPCTHPPVRVLHRPVGAGRWWGCWGYRRIAPHARLCTPPGGVLLGAKPGAESQEGKCQAAPTWSRSPAKPASPRCALV